MLSSGVFDFQKPGIHVCRSARKVCLAGDYFRN